MDRPPDAPRIGVDEWVANVEGKRERTPGWGADQPSRDGYLPPRGSSCSRLRPLFSIRHHSGEPFRTALHARLRTPGARSQHRRRVRRPPRSRLRRVLRNRRDLCRFSLPLGSATTGRRSLRYRWWWSARRSWGWSWVSLRAGVGDYLAILTLFFGQAFVIFVNNANRIGFPFFGHVDLTGGSTGSPDIDRELLRLQGHQTIKQYYLLLIVVSLVSSC